MIVLPPFEMASENFSLYINELQTQKADFQKLSYYFSCYFVVFGEIVVPLHSGFG